MGSNVWDGENYAERTSVAEGRTDAEQWAGGNTHTTWRMAFLRAFTRVGDEAAWEEQPFHCE